MPLPNGSEPWYHRSLPTVYELAFAFQVPEDEFRSKLRNQGLDVSRDDPLPFEVAAAALMREGWEPRRLERLR